MHGCWLTRQLHALPPTMDRRPGVFHSAQVSKSPPRAPAEIAVLPRSRPQLDRGHGSQRINRLFSAEDPVGAIRALSPDEFFYVLHELGFPEALEVMVHGTAEQVQGALDLAIWDRDQISVDRSNEWVTAMAQAPFETVGAWARGLDVELLAWVFRQRMRIYDLSQEEAPEEIEGNLLTTPDRLFALELLGGEETQLATQHLVENLYRADQDLMPRLLVGMRAELDSELEETAYRWRAGRMADVGFVDFYEALEIYRELDPALVHLAQGPAPSVLPCDGSESPLPAVIADRLSGATLFAQAMAGLTDDKEAAEVRFALVALCNRALSADRVSPGDDGAVAGVLGRVAATLDLALEFLIRRDKATGTDVLRRLPLSQVFRLGTSLVGKLRKLARALVSNSPFSPLRPGLDLWEPEDEEVLTALTKLRPLFPRQLDNPPAAGERPFATLHDLALATTAVEHAGAALALVLGLGVRLEHLSPERLDSLGITDPAVIDTGLLARTILVQRLLGVPAGPLEPLSSEAKLKFKEQFTKDGQVDESMVKSAALILQSASPGERFTPASEAVATRWLRSLAPLGPVLVGPK